LAVVLPGNGMSWKQFFLDLKTEVTRDNITDIAAGVTYYLMLALFPFLLFLVALVSLVITPQQAEDLVRQLGRFLPAEVTEIVGGRIHALVEGPSIGLVTFGIVVALWSASGSVAALMRALNTAYGVEEGRPWWKRQAIALFMTIFTAVLALIGAGIAVALAPVGAAIGGPVGTAIQWLRLPVAGAIVMFLWAVLHYVLPDVEQRFRFITPGSVVGVILWLIASWGFSMYVSHFGNYDKIYGSLGGVIVLLLWMWISSLAVLLGAEVNVVIEHRSPEGKRAGAKAMADSGATPPPAQLLRGATPALLSSATRDALAPGPSSGPAPARDGHARTLPLLAGLAAGLLLLRRRPG
jgi:membrane protein